MSSDPATYVSSHRRYCEGARDPGRYVIAVNVAAAKVTKRFGHEGSTELDEVIAFDTAEIAEMDMGQLNLIKVSSFCGPHGFVWGADIADAVTGSTPLFSVPSDAGDIEVHDGELLISAARELFGTVDDRRFRIAPGSHCPSAYGRVVHEGPGAVYAAIGLGMRQEGSDSATILMEDRGIFDPYTTDASGRKGTVMHKVAESVVQVASNQRIGLGRIYVAYRETVVGEGEIGCALVAVPYFTLAQDAVPDGSVADLRDMTLRQWKEQTSFNV